MTEIQTKAISPRIEKQFRLLDKKLNLLLEELKDYSDSQLNRKPGAEKWSVIQVMHHLLLAETGSYNYLQKKMSFNPDLGKAGVKSWFRKTGLKFFLWAPFKWKAPVAIGEENLPENAGFWDTAKQWKEQRELLRNLLQKLPAETFKKEAYKHPMAGRMDITGMLSFFEWHFNRHHKQIKRIVKDYPKQT